MSMKVARAILLACLLLTVVVSAIQAATTTNTGNSSSSAQVATLKEQLESGLRARRPQEFAFIQRVVTMVDRKQLPLKVVKSTFQWARRKKPYQYPFFERALKIRAARLGITVR